MAEKKKRVVKKAESVRDRAKKADIPKKPGKAKRVVSAAGKPIKSASQVGRKEYHLIKLPENKLGKFLSKRVHFMPSYLRNAWNEIKQVEWPNARETTKLTAAVLTFAIIFGAIVYVLDFGLNKLFREILLG